MEWGKERLRALRCRMGWSHSDLARRLRCESQVVMQWEAGDESPVKFHLEALELLEKQADVHCDELLNSTLCDLAFEESDSEQLDINTVKNRYS